MCFKKEQDRLHKIVSMNKFFYIIYLLRHKVNRATLIACFVIIVIYYLNKCCKYIFLYCLDLLN